MIGDNIFRKRTDRSILMFGLILLIICGTLTACGTFEIGLEPELEPDSDQLNATQTSAAPTTVEDTATKTVPAQITLTPFAASNDLTEEPSEEIEAAVEAATMVPTPIAARPVLQIVYAKENNVWLWSEKNGPVALTKNGGVEDVLLSDDGLRIAFRRGGNIWVVNSDGSDERQLTTELDFEGISFGEDSDPYVIGITPYQMSWQPGTHTLYFNTFPQLEGPGLMLTDDLWVVDADVGKATTLLPKGEGGKFTISPDGSIIAMSTPGTISLFDTNSNDSRQVFTYTPIRTYSEFQYYVEPSWAADSKRLAVAIPPADPMAPADQLISIWFISLDGAPARLMGHIEATLGLQTQPLFPPDLSQIIYMVGDTQGTPTAVSIAVIDTGDVSEGVDEVRTYPFQVEVLDSWSSDGSRFVFAPPFDGTAPRRQIATVAGEVSDVGEAGAAVFQIRWIDNNRYLYLQSNARGWSIMMAQLSDDTFVPIDGVIGGPPAFDFDS